DRSTEVVERREHHWIAVARADPLGLNDDPPHPHEVLIPPFRQRGERTVHARAKRLAQRLQRMRRDEQPDRLLLPGKQLRLLELLRRDRRMDRARQSRRTLCGGHGRLQVEDRALADEGVLLRLLTGGLSFLENREHPLAARSGRAE